MTTWHLTNFLWKLCPQWARDRTKRTMADLTVRLADRFGGALEKVLVRAEILARGKVVWSTVLGLTDERGMVAVDSLEQLYREDQERFPMDYKLPFATFDQVRVAVPGGKEFPLLAKGADSPIVEPQFRQWWREARNPDVGSACTEPLDLGTAMHVDLSLATEADAG
jgi:hypothetical protein